MNYKVSIEDGILKAKVDGRHTIWMYYAPRGKTVEQRPGIYVLTDDRGYCCYVGEASNVKTRLPRHEGERKLQWWTHVIYFCDEGLHAFASTGDRHWYEKNLKEVIETKHPTFTERVQNEPEPTSGKEVLCEMMSLLNVIGFKTLRPSQIPSDPQPMCLHGRSQQHKRQSSEPVPNKNHHPPLGAWPTYTALAKAIADKNGKPGTAGGIQQKLTNFWVPSRRRYAKANATTRQMLESFKIVFDSEGFVKSCANVPNPLP